MHFRSIQLLRGLAALLVVFVHDVGAYDYFIALAGFKQPSAISSGSLRLFGASGVHLFFVISGFVIAHQAHQSGLPGFIQFSINRIRRIVPPYWIATTIMLAISPNNPFHTWDHVTKSFLFVPIENQHPILNVGWTLNYEMYFYTLFAFTVVLIGARSFMVIIGVLVLMVAGSWSDTPWANLTGSPIVLEFILGVTAQSLYRSETVAKIAPLILTVGSALFLSTAFWFRPGMFMGNDSVLAWGLPAFLVVLGSTSWEFKAEKKIRQSTLTFIGDASYSIYLTHALLFRGTWGVFPTLFLHTPVLTLPAPWVAIAIMITFSLAVGCVFHIFVEKPVTKWTGRLLNFIVFPPPVEVLKPQLADAMLAPQLRTASGSE